MFFTWSKGTNPSRRGPSLPEVVISGILPGVIDSGAIWPIDLPQDVRGAKKTREMPNINYGKRRNCFGQGGLFKLMSEYLRRKFAEAREKFGPTPTQWTFGQDIDWTVDLEGVELRVELPFWLMMPEGNVKVSWSGIVFDISILQMQMEVFKDFFTDSRQTRIGELPLKPEIFMDPTKLDLLSAAQKRPVFPRMCKTVLVLSALAHSDAFRDPTDAERPAVSRQREVYRESLCEAHIPVVNELIQRYRYTTYDYFAYEVSAWDVPVWALNFRGNQYRALLIPYRGWDQRPVIVTDGFSPEPEP